MSTLQIEYSTGDTASQSINDSYGEGYAVGQIFTTSGAFLLDSVALKMYKTAGATSSFSVSVVSLSGGAIPLLGTPEFTAARVAEAYGDTNNLGTDTGGTWLTFDMSSAAETLAASTGYAIVVAYAGGTEIHWRTDGTGTYADGRCMHYQADPAQWGEWVGTVDAMFKVYSGYVFTPPDAGPTKKWLIGAAEDALWYEDV
ncbi:MAG: hypothetical protein GY832_31580 [Chloroflexi bacterium]|nr:hypothetical protein [Chloroflexota bacterium]